jgi:3-methyladenine DNA glycosylase/8-oxoguanine DNA glycosylase
LPAEDLGIQNASKRLYALESHPKPAVIRALALEGRWHPFATGACLYLWDSLDAGAPMR